MLNGSCNVGFASSPIAHIAYHNKAAIYGLLFTAAAEATLTIAADPKRLGAKIGITAVLHSWGSAMTHHPHVHMIVPGGGISLDDTRWVPCRPGFFAQEQSPKQARENPYRQKVGSRRQRPKRHSRKLPRL
jgi:hypothetical protein